MEKTTYYCFDCKKPVSNIHTPLHDTESSEERGKPLTGWEQLAQSSKDQARVERAF